MTAGRIPWMLATMAVTVLGGSNAMAQANPIDVARVYVVKPKPGMVAQFEAALREHAQWRADNGDPWDWNVSSTETGEDLGAFQIRSGGHTWADFDAYDVGFGMQGLVQWNATVAPLVESVSSAITTMNPELSKPMPEGTPFSFVTITRFHLRPGQEQAFNRLVTDATEIIREKLAGYWVWDSPVAGGGMGPYIDLVGFSENWAGMAQPDPSFDAIMIEALGEDDFAQWMGDFGATYRSIESWTLRRRPEMDVR